MKDTAELIADLLSKGLAVIAGGIIQWVGWNIAYLPKAFWIGLKNGWTGNQIYHRNH